MHLLALLANLWVEGSIFDLLIVKLVFQALSSLVHPFFPCLIALQELLYDGDLLLRSEFLVLKIPSLTSKVDGDLFVFRGDLDLRGHT